MGPKKISWEIVLAGLAFIAIAIYLMQLQEEPWHETRASGSVFPHIPHIPAPPAPPSPGSVVIDLRELESLKELERLEELEQLEVNIQDIERILRERETDIEASVEESLKKLEEDLKKEEQSDLRVLLKNNKIFISKDYDVQEETWSEVSPGVFVFRKKIDPAGLQEVVLNLGVGNINIDGTENEESELVIRATGDLDNREEMYETLPVETVEEDGRLTYQLAASDGALQNRRLNVETTLRIPEQMAVSASTSGGHINANNLGDLREVSTSGGHITLINISGDAGAKTSGGHIEGENITGNFKLFTSGGHINLVEGRGVVDAQTRGGHIKMKEFLGEGEVRTSGGNISGSIAGLEGPLTLSTSAGNISLRIPSGLNADIQASGTSVSIDNLFKFNGEQTKNKLEGTLNGGGPQLNLRCDFGNISIEGHE